MHRIARSLPPYVVYYDMGVSWGISRTRTRIVQTPLLWCPLGRRVMRSAQQESRGDIGHGTFFFRDLRCQGRAWQIAYRPSYSTAGVSWKVRGYRSYKYRIPPTSLHCEYVPENLERLIVRSQYENWERRQTWHLFGSSGLRTVRLSCAQCRHDWMSGLDGTFSPP